MPQISDDESLPIQRHKTALKRYALSRPLRLAVADGLITTQTEVLDYGCGHGTDVQQLSAAGIPTRGWDPVFSPQGDRSPADVVNLGYVVNVIEDARERGEVLRSAWERSKLLLVVSARLKQDIESPAWLQFGDGYVTRSGTFQKFYEHGELRDWIEEVTGSPAIPAAPGVFFVFRSELARTEYVASRFRREPRPPRIIDRFKGAKETLAPLMSFVATHGRLPVGNEVSEFEDVATEFGTLKRAFQRIRTATDKGYWDGVRRDRAQDLSVFLALSRFGKRPRFHELPEAMQHDVRAFFGTYTRACSEADQMLQTAGRRDEIDRACRDSEVGKKTPTALYVHSSALAQLSPVLRLYEGCARVLTGTLEGANVLKLHRDKPAVSYLWYPSFDEEAHPLLFGSFIVLLGTQEVRYRDYSASENPPILHRKEEFVGAEYPNRSAFAALTASEEQAGLFDEPEQIGTSKGWIAALNRRRLIVREHDLVPEPSAE